VTKLTIVKGKNSWARPFLKALAKGRQPARRDLGVKRARFMAPAPLIRRRIESLNHCSGGPSILGRCWHL